MSPILQAIDKAFTEAKLPNHQLLTSGPESRTYRTRYAVQATQKGRRTSWPTQRRRPSSCEPWRSSYIAVWPIHMAPDHKIPFLALLEHDPVSQNSDELRLLTYGDLWNKTSKWRAPFWFRSLFFPKPKLAAITDATPLITNYRISHHHSANPNLIQELLSLITLLQAGVSKNAAVPCLLTLP